MKIVIGVEGFGKIKKADIDISNYSIFVGDNNSGKTYLMQLIYGVLQYLRIPQNYESKYVGAIYQHDVESILITVLDDVISIFSTPFAPFKVV